MDNNKDDRDNQTTSQKWFIIAIVFIILSIVLIGVSSYFGYKLLNCNKKPNAVVFID